MTDRETQLWTWLLFNSQVKPAQAKALLKQWQQAGLSAEQALQTIQQSASKWGLTRELGAHLAAIPSPLPDHPALRWNDARYPAGLARLPEQHQPALLFTKGDANLLQRPLIFLLPGVILDDSQEMLRETISLLLGDRFVVAAFAGTSQSEILQSEMAWTEGDGLIFAASGLENHSSDPFEQDYVDAGRLCVVSPLPPSAPENPRWLPLLTSIATTSAHGVIAFNETRDAVMDLDAQTRVLWLTLEPHKVPRHPQITASDMPADVLAWSEIGLESDEEAAPYYVTPTGLPDAGLPDYAHSDGAIDDVELGPPPTPAQVIDTLAKGGTIPQALRDKLLGN